MDTAHAHSVISNALCPVELAISYGRIVLRSIVISAKSFIFLRVQAGLTELSLELR